MASFLALVHWYLSLLSSKCTWKVAQPVCNFHTKLPKVENHCPTRVLYSELRYLTYVREKRKGKLFTKIHWMMKTLLKCCPVVKNLRQSWWWMCSTAASVGREP